MSHKFIPLEANPHTFNALATALGLDTSKFCLHDVFSFDDELLSFIPQPVQALIVLTPEVEWYAHPKRVEKDEEDMKKWKVEGKEGLVFFRQTEKLENHCGTIALLHSLANSPSLPLADGDMKDLFTRCRGLSPDKSADLLESTDISVAHDIASQMGQSRFPETDTSEHFLALVNYNGHVVEFGGWARSEPISHGPIEGDLLRSAIKVVKKMMDETDSINFSVMALAPNNIEE